MPGVDLAAQIFIEHRLEQKVIFVANQRHVTCSGQLKRAEQPAESAAED